MNNSMYFKLAKDNIKKNSQTYLPYIVSAIITVTMFYILSALADNEDLKLACASDSISVMLRFGSIVAGLFAVIFLFYTNNFLIKRRKKEFGLYNILGMEKKHIARIIFLETLAISIISIVLGLGIGILFTKLMILLLLYAFNNIVPIGFFISFPSIMRTIILFAAIFVLIFLNNIRQVHMSKPIELLKSSSTGEKEPKAKKLMALLGIMCIAAGYYIAVTTTNPIAALTFFFVAVILVIIGTYLLFTAGSIVLLKALKKNKNYYYKTKNFISVSSMIYRMKQNAVGLANICILSTMVLVTVSSTVSLWFGVDGILKQFYPKEITCSARKVDMDYIAEAKKVLNKNLNKYNLTPKDEKEYIYLTFATIEKGDTFKLDRNVYSDVYNDLRCLYFIDGEDSYDLKDDEVLICSDRGDFNYDTLKILDFNFKIKDKLTEDELGFTGFKENVAGNHFIIVKNRDILNKIYEKQESVYKEDSSNIQYFYGFDLDANTDTILKFHEDVMHEHNTNDADDDFDYSKFVNIDCREFSKSNLVGLYAGFLFIGVFLGTLFTVAAILIMYYKQISEGYEDRERFEILQKVGLSHAEVKKSIHSQILLVFFMPLVIAGIHIAFAFPFITRIMALLNLVNVPLLAMWTLISYLVFALFYGIVYKITAKVYYKIVS